MKKTIFWILAIIITLSSAYYQRKTGPTYPKKINIELSGNILDFKLPRSNVSEVDCFIEIPINNPNIQGDIYYKRFPTNDKFNIVKLNNENSILSGYLPKQTPAGKLEYYIRLSDDKSAVSTEHVVIRFKGSVPAWALIPHILFMFVAMLISNLSGLFAAGKVQKHVFYGKLTLGLLILGGLVFGPIVQYYAFGQAWTGIPFGWDLTDNKTLIAVLFWIIAVLGNRKSPKYRYTLIAAIVLFLIYIIPHSLLGSELDYTSGEVVTGFIQVLL
ncbi:MAG: hypothetical protein JEY96_01935 [Bacteroidales bacterium]|nr:hypothetical protein [Bacteroidales bacterium]